MSPLRLSTTILIAGGSGRRLFSIQQYSQPASGKPSPPHDDRLQQDGESTFKMLIRIMVFQHFVVRIRLGSYPFCTSRPMACKPVATALPSQNSFIYKGMRHLDCIALGQNGEDPKRILNIKSSKSVTRINILRLDSSGC